MTKLNRRILIGGLAASASLNFPLYTRADESLNQLIVMTEEYPPFNFMKDGKLSGISVDIVVEMLKRVKTNHSREDIQFLPWARGYNLTLQRKGHALFSTTRTSEREEKFKWVGPFVPTIIGLTAKKSNMFKINSGEDIRKLRIGVVKDDIGQQLLEAIGMPEDRMEIVLTNEQNYKKLRANRIDAVAYETQVAKWGLQTLGEDLSQYEVIHELKRGDLYLALHKATPDLIIEKLQQSFDSLVKDGTHRKIIEHYVG